MSPSSSSLGYGRIGKSILAAIGVAAVVLQIVLLVCTRNDIVRISSEQARENEVAVEQKRREYQHHCADDSWSKETLEGLLADLFASGSSAMQFRAAASEIQPCEFVFLDYGANVGDSMGKFINAGIPQCPEKGIEAALYNVTKGAVETTRKQSNRLTAWSHKMMKETSKQLGRTDQALEPEAYCYYGIEGNPAFTKTLSKLESTVMKSNPRPVRSAHFYTETVGAASDGPAILYLDTVNTKENYWGSSIYSSHQDVQASKTNGELVEAQVQGMTLTTLLKETTLKSAGSHVMIKLDVEGAEYGLLNEAYDSGVLCDYVGAAVRVDMLVELHPASMVGEADESLKRWKSEVHRKLIQCGVNLFTGRNAG